jgi:hypothetical protein
MRDAVYKRLMSKFTQPSLGKEDKLTYEHYAKVAGQINFLIGKTLQSKDVAALKLLTSSISYGLYDFYKKTVQPFEHVNRVLKELHIGLAQENFTFYNSTKKPVVVPIMLEQLYAIQESMPELRNRKYVYEMAASQSGINVDTLNDWYTHPDSITPQDQMLMLAIGLRPKPGFKNFTPENIFQEVRDNLGTHLLLRTNSNGYSSFCPRLSDKQLLSEEMQSLPEHFLGFQHIVPLYFKALNDVKPLVTIENLIGEFFLGQNPYEYYFEDRELHLKKLLGSNSLTKTVQTYIAHMGSSLPNLTEGDDGNPTWVSTKIKISPHHFLRHLNEDVLLTRAVANHLDKLSGALFRGTDKIFQRYNPVHLVAPFKNFFARQQYPYAPSYGVSKNHITKLCIIDLELRGMAKFLCAIGQNIDNQSEQLRHFEWMGEKLPYPTISYVLENKLVSYVQAKSLLTGMDTLDNRPTYSCNPEFTIKNVAKIFALSERNYQGVFTNTLRYERILDAIKEVELLTEYKGLYDAEFTRQFYANVTDNLVSEQANADVSFLEARSL